jgi:hypothetical protein
MRLFGSITFCEGKNREGAIRIVVFRVRNRRVFPFVAAKLDFPPKAGSPKRLVRPIHKRRKAAGKSFGSVGRGAKAKIFVLALPY